MAAVRFTPSVETPAPDEAETIAAIIEQMKIITATTYEDTGHAIRSVHAKAHGLVRGTLTIADGLPPELAQGLFAAPGTFDARVRISTSPGDILDDHISTPRGIAIKVQAPAGVQDFLLVDGPAFLAPTPKAFLANLKLLAKTTDRFEGLKRAFSAAARGLETVVEATGHKSGVLTGLGGHKLTHPLGETFWSQVPIRYGEYVAKVQAVPVSPNLTALTDAAVDLRDKPDGLREAVVAELARAGGTWEIRVQLCADLDRMPIEDASVEWPEALSPFRTVARLDVPPQASWTPDLIREIDDGAAFTPWHCLEAHRPLGGVMRARQPVYAALQAERSARSGCPFA